MLIMFKIYHAVSGFDKYVDICGNECRVEKYGNRREDEMDIQVVTEQWELDVVMYEMRKLSLNIVMGNAFSGADIEMFYASRVRVQAEQDTTKQN